MKFCSSGDWDSSRLGNSVVVETEIHRDWEILWLSRPRVIETCKFCGCRDRDSSRLGNSLVVETKTDRDWEILWLSRLRLNETGNFCGCRDRDQSRLTKSCRDRDFFESLVNHWILAQSRIWCWGPLLIPILPYAIQTCMNMGNIGWNLRKLKKKRFLDRKLTIMVPFFCPFLFLVF